MWNVLPEELSNSSSKFSFKKHLKKHILNSLQYWKTLARKSTCTSVEQIIASN